VRGWLTTLLELFGASVVTYGVFFQFGVGIACIVAGCLIVGLSWLLSAPNSAPEANE
jgi:hypothetical protein